MEGEQAIHAFLAYLHTLERSLKTVIGYQSDVKRFRAFYEHKHQAAWYVEDTTHEDILAFLHTLKTEEGLQPATRNRILFGLRTFFDFCKRQHWIEYSPMEDIPPVTTPKVERKVIPLPALEIYLQQVDHPIVAAAAWTMLYSGLRISECMALTFHDVEWEPEARIIVRHGKGNKSRIVPISHKLREILQTYETHHRPRVNVEERYFATERTGQLSPSQFTRVLHQIAEQRHWPMPITAHMLRHAFATELVRKGVNLVQIQKLLGHSSLSVTSVYTHAQMTELQDAVDRL
ncbi:tyrosine-type recombinase/integrase [Alicyclobacillus tolerans]|uniref:tyrosine-type recombinase/integrase n=1 Tax=Alicyclobacillus tolerans TaxID=90970 RepID=UPI003B7E513B